MVNFLICMSCGLKFREQFITDKILIDLCKAQAMDFCSIECYNKYEADFGFNEEEKEIE